MRIAIFGTGGVGGYFGGRLAQAGEDVTFIARGEHLRAIKTTGLHVESTGGDFLINPAKATDDVHDIGEGDLIIVGVKAWQVPEAARAMKPMLGPTTTVLPLENGVEAPQQLTAELGQASVIGGLCKIVSYIVEPGRIRHAGLEPSVTIGELDNRRTKRVETIYEVFNNAGIDTTIATDINVALWTKFLFIVSFSGVAALMQKPAGDIRSNSESRSLIVKAMEEIYTLAKARGIDMPSDSVEKGMTTVDSLPNNGTSSMQRDIVAGRPSELESQNGAVVRMAREVGVEVPTHELIYSALHPLEKEARRRRA